MLWTRRDSVQRYSREDGMADSAMATDAGKKRSHILDANYAAILESVQSGCKKERSVHYFDCS